MRIASLDLGSNTTLMLIADIDHSELTVVEDFSAVTRMGQEMAQTGQFHKEALARLDQCLARYSAAIREYNVDFVAAVATSAARDAKNAPELKAITDRYHIPVQVISGQAEAEMTFLGSSFDQPSPAECLVIDIGGGSTEIVAIGDDEAVIGTSLDIGSVRLIDLFIKNHPVPSEQLDLAREFIDEAFDRNEDLANLSRGKQAVAVAGTPTTLSMLMQEVDYNEEKIHRHRFSRQQVQEWLEKLAGLSVEDRKRLPGMPEKRADVIVAGCLILHQVMEKLGFEELTVSTKGVRYGLAIQEHRQRLAKS